MARRRGRGIGEFVGGAVAPAVGRGAGGAIGGAAPAANVPEWLESYVRGPKARNALVDALEPPTGRERRQAQGQEIDPAFAAAIERRDPNALAFIAAGSPEISQEFAAQAEENGRPFRQFLKANGGGDQLDPAVAQLMQGQQQFAQNHGGRMGLRGGTPVGEGSGTQLGVGGMPAGVSVAESGQMQGRAGITVEKNGRKFQVFFGSDGRRRIVPVG